MSGLAIVSKALGARGHRLGPRRVLLHGPAARARDRAGHRPRRRQRARRRRRWSSPRPSRPTTRSWRRPSGPAAAPRRAARARSRGSSARSRWRARTARPRPAAWPPTSLVEAGRDPAYLIGGELRSTGTNAAWGEGEWIVVEADESDRSFLELARDVAVVTNVELDHHHTYRSLAELEAAFAEFTDGRRRHDRRPGLGRPRYGIGGRPAGRGLVCPLGAPVHGRGRAGGAERARPPQRAERAGGAGRVP